MNKSILIALVTAFSLAACGGKEESKFLKDDNAKNNSATSLADTTKSTNNQAAQPSTSSTIDKPSSKDVRIKLTFDNEEFIVKMYDNPTSRDFLTRLPLTLTFKEFGGFEKLSILDKELSTENAPSGSDPEVGDFGYYAPWKDVNMYYKDWSHSSGLVKLGKIESGIEVFSKKLQDMNGDFAVTIQQMN
ncbi:cyclophilin-like fold protein [Paenibacillus alginolyticus]|uniref:Cyclophilin-like fold protein n=1 Tax=Paenibacillus alginolyticus TaxID=59839 RepID=A0ABT4GH90_9BACL|nr:cyclophilin-like fold protein [Paenibacillus alginolyticus]MCY9695439.1 cyclophilin-like fold protein [Paenibacillus alginolyticus]MEC0148817.1 cyclophilin-like fold protein [Paenibacillus alginolyticus]